MVAKQSSTTGTLSDTPLHADMGPIYYFTHAGNTEIGFPFVLYATDDGLTTCNESLRIFYPDDYWSWPKR